MRQLALISALGVLIAGVARAQPIPGPYISLGAGGSFLQDQDVSPHGLYGPSPRTFGFDAGGAFNAAVGFGLPFGLRFEVEGDYITNHATSVYIKPIPGVFPGGSGYASGNEHQYGGFANLYYDIDTGGPVTPYIGAGAGYQEIELDHVHSNLSGLPDINPTDPSEGAFAYQAIAGVSYAVPVVPGLSVGAEYRFVGVSTPPAFSRGTGYVDGAVVTEHATFSHIYDHELLLAFRYSFWPPAPPPPPPPAPPPPPPPQVQEARTYLVFFDWDRADLTARARQIVAEAAQASTHVQTTRIEVNGYTDLSGTAAYNQRLSVRRAESVEAELIRDGVPKTEIDIHGYGESNPLVPTAKGVREPQNRRVEIILK